MGSAAAFHLARRGCTVVGFDRFVPPHSLGSSHGQTRIIREAYFEHPLYVPLVDRAYELWLELERQSGHDLLRITGGLMIGPPDGELVAGARRSADEHGLPYELLTAAEVTKRFPALTPVEGMVALWEPRAGVLFPETCVSAHLEMARRHGATLELGHRVTRWTIDGDGVRVETESGEYRAERLLLTSGSWLPSLVPEADLPLIVKRQVLHWFEPPDGSAALDPEHCPIHLWETQPGRFVYGFPDFGQGVKLAVHHEGEITDPDSVRRDVGADEVSALRDRFRPYLAAVDGRWLESVVCMYTNTPDGHFWIDSHPGAAQVLVVSACSGHGFKFASVIGEIVADLVTGATQRFDLTPFRRR